MRFLPPGYGLSLTRLDDEPQYPAWPVLLLHSRSAPWLPDAGRRPPTPIADGVANRAQWLGLHPVTDPFAAELAAAARPWTFRMPTQRCPARITWPDGGVGLARVSIEPEWWSLAVQRGGRCRLLIASAVTLPADPEEAGGALSDAAAAGRVHGATIAVDF